jgi:hypothetical protein
MAGFQVFMYGRFWVFTEEKRAAARNKRGVTLVKKRAHA